HVKKLSSEEQKNLICGILEDLATDSNVELLYAHLRHCGLPLSPRVTSVCPFMWRARVSGRTRTRRSSVDAAPRIA
uniref:hypothetical protein n=1 Tax=uncultured Paracoccus sp. TaxID=189685 RepID=UPI00261E5F16